MPFYLEGGDVHRSGVFDLLTSSAFLFDLVSARCNAGSFSTIASCPRMPKVYLVKPKCNEELYTFYRVLLSNDLYRTYGDFVHPVRYRFIFGLDVQERTHPISRTSTLLTIGHAVLATTLLPARSPLTRGTKSRKLDISIAFLEKPRQEERWIVKNPLGAKNPRPT